MAFRITSTQTPSGATATITANKTTVLPGEAVVLEITNYGFAYSDERKLSVKWDFDDPGGAYTTGNGWSSNVSYIPFTNKYWHTQGTKNPSVQIFDEDGNLAATGTIAITVEDPDSVSWTRDYTVSNASQWAAVVPASAGERVRVTITDDVTINIGTNGYSTGGANARTYITASFTGTNRPVLTTTTLDQAAFTAQRDGAGFEFIIYGIHGLGAYSQKTGTGNHWTLVRPRQAPSALSTFVSVTACKMLGGNLVAHTGSEQTYGGGLYAYSDLYVRDWYDYAINRFGEWADVTMTGVDVRSDPEGLRWTGGSNDDPPAAADHCVRFGCVRKVGVESNLIYNNIGWSVISEDWAANPSLRIHPTTHTQTAAIWVKNNEFFNLWQTVAVGEVNGTRGFEVPARIVAVDMNTHIVGFQSRWPIQIGGQPASFQNNFVYVIDSDAPFALNNVLELRASPTATATNNGDALIEFNTFISRRGGTFDAVTIGWGGTPVVSEQNNLIYCPNASNSGSFTDYTPLSAGDNFAPVNDGGGAGVSAAHNAVSSGYIPYFDRAGNVRGATANIGAYDVSPTSVTAVSAVVNSVVPPAPVEMTGFVDVWKLPNLGTWNYDTSNYEPYLFQTNWRSNGSQITEFYRIALDNTGGLYDGDAIDCIVTYTNFSGTETSATSSSVIVGGLAPSSGVTVTSNGQIVENLDITASGTGINVGSFSNVTIRNCRISYNNTDGANNFGIKASGGSNLLIEDCEIINDGSPDRGANSSIDQNCIDLFGMTTATTIRRVTLRRGSAGIYALECANCTFQFIEGHDFRGPFFRGQLMQLNKCTGTHLVEDVSLNSIPGTSYSEDHINVLGTPNVTFNRVKYDFLPDSPSGSGLLLELGDDAGSTQSDDCSVNGYEAEFLFNGFVSVYGADNFVVTNARVRYLLGYSNRPTGSGDDTDGLSLSNELMILADPQGRGSNLTGNSFTVSHYLVNNSNLSWDNANIDTLNLTDTNWTPSLSFIRNSFPWRNSTSAPVIDLPVRIETGQASATPVAGETLYVLPGRWAHDPTSRTWQWYRDGSPVSADDVSGRAYTLTSADAGTTITVGEVASNANGAGTENISAGVAIGSGVANLLTDGNTLDSATWTGNATKTNSVAANDGQTLCKLTSNAGTFQLCRDEYNFAGGQAYTFTFSAPDNDEYQYLGARLDDFLIPTAQRYVTYDLVNRTVNLQGISGVTAGFYTDSFGKSRCYYTCTPDAGLGFVDLAICTSTGSTDTSMSAGLEVTVGKLMLVAGTSQDDWPGDS